MVFGSGVILVPKMAPNGVFIRYPPANGCPPGRVWHAPQCPAAERASPLATSSAEKLDGLGGSIGAIEGRHAKRNKPANMKQAVTSIRSRCGESSLSFSNRSRSSYWNSISIHSPIRLSPQLTNCLPDRIRRISILNLTIDSRASGICVVVGPKRGHPRGIAWHAASLPPRRQHRMFLRKRNLGTGERLPEAVANRRIRSLLKHAAIGGLYLNFKQ
jgi:hypothetical protein